DEGSTWTEPIAPVVKKCIFAREEKPYFYLDEAEVVWKHSAALKNAGESGDKQTQQKLQQDLDSIKERRKRQMVIDCMLSYTRYLFTNPECSNFKAFFSVWKARHLTFVWNFMGELYLLSSLCQGVNQ